MEWADTGQCEKGRWVGKEGSVSFLRISLSLLDEASAGNRSEASPAGATCSRVLRVRVATLKAGDRE